MIIIIVIIIIIIIIIHLQSAVSSDINQSNFDLIWDDLQVFNEYIMKSLTTCPVYIGIMVHMVKGRQHSAYTV